MSVVRRAQSRPYDELLQAVVRERADFFYGGTARALAVTQVAARRWRVPYALDLEDFHSEESDEAHGGRLANQLAERIERDVLPGAAFLTAGSTAIADAYGEKYGLHPLPIHNTFALPDTAPPLDVPLDDGLRLYWFSQTIGRGRGLEDAVRAIGIAGIPGMLALRGLPSPGYLDELHALARDVAPRLRITQHDPAPPDAMIELARGHHIGLALERTEPRNRDLCLTNKAFIYMLGGLAVAFSSTRGQRTLAHSLGIAAVCYAPGDVADLAARFRCWYQDPSHLRAAKSAAWEAAHRRWHWDHAEERGALLRAVRRLTARHQPLPH
jgi:glycosyltransferase involved in cell wall biosynthesis